MEEEDFDDEAFQDEASRCHSRHALGRTAPQKVKCFLVQRPCFLGLFSSSRAYLRTCWNAQEESDDDEDDDDDDGDDSEFEEEDCPELESARGSTIGPLRRKAKTGMSWNGRREAPKHCVIHNCWVV